jgi:hypothetical protein
VKVTASREWVVIAIDVDERRKTIAALRGRKRNSR